MEFSQQAREKRSKGLRKRLSLLIIRKMQIKAIMSYPLLPVTMAIKKKGLKGTDDKCCSGRKENCWPC